MDCEQIGFSNSKNLSKSILKKETAMKYLAGANIDAGSQSIIVS
ncbi:hypothetical protein [Clostridium sp. DL-VIII]|nr:hypothetical protein [Clostridium sp. DL-VIII]